MLLTRATAGFLLGICEAPVTGSLVLLATTGALAVSAGLLAASLKPRNAPAYLLAIYVIASAEIVLLIAALSFADLVVRWAVVAGVAALVAASALVWLLTGRARGPSPDSMRRALGDALRDPPIAILAAAVGLGFAYLAALALLTPPNSVDALWYHLARAAYWKQTHAVGYIPHANDARLNGNPPVAEIGVLYTMVVAGTDRFVTTVALAAYAAVPLAIFGIGRRLLVDRRSALCAALAFATLPVVALQAPTALNDLVIASFAAACVYFFLGRQDAELALAGVALALALGTKVYGPMLLPLIVLVILLGSPRTRTFKLWAVVVAGILVGSAWYVVNVVETGSTLGDLISDRSDQLTRGLAGFVAGMVRYLINFGEVPGAAGWWTACYVATALAVLALIVRRRGSWSPPSIATAALLSLAPFLVIALGPVAKRAYQYILFHVGQPDLGALGHGRGLFSATPMNSLYGPLGLALLLSVIPMVALRRRVPRVAIVLAAAPLLLVIEIAFFVGYGDLNGRFFVFGVALAAAAFALFLRSRPVIWAVVALSVPTLALTLRANFEKPPSVWGEPRWKVQTRYASGTGEADLIRFAAQSLPRGADVGLAIDARHWSYPYFGADLRRRVEFVPSLQAVPSRLDWLIVAPGRAVPPRAWRQVLRTADDFRVYRR
jgi:hypothetical protein